MYSLPYGMAHESGRNLRRLRLNWRFQLTKRDRIFLDGGPTLPTRPDIKLGKRCWNHYKHHTLHLSVRCLYTSAFQCSFPAYIYASCIDWKNTSCAVDRWNSFVVSSDKLVLAIPSGPLGIFPTANKQTVLRRKYTGRSMSQAHSGCRPSFYFCVCVWF